MSAAHQSDRPDLSDLITASAAARLLGWHIQTLYRYVRRGKLRSWGLGGRLRLSRREVEALVRERVLPERTPRQRERRGKGAEAEAWLRERGW